MRKKVWFVVLAAISCGFASCGEVDRSCITDGDCDYPREVCHRNTKVCVIAGSDKEPDVSWPTLGMACKTDGDCAAMVEECDRSLKVCVEKAFKMCYNDSDCINRHGAGYTCDDGYCRAPVADEPVQVQFKLQYDTRASNFSFASQWGAILAQFSARPKLVMMLCNIEDEVCNEPVLTRELTEADGYTQPIQNTSGPTIKLYDLPEGWFHMVVFADSERSVALGEDYKTTKNGTTYGGMISETDMVTIANDEEPTENNPPIATVPIIVKKDAEMQDLGTLNLSHFHERDISTHPDGENGYIVTATQTGLRMVDLKSYSLLSGNSGRYSHDFQFVDESNNVIQDSVCGLIKADDETVWVLFSGKNDGYAVPFNPKTQTQIGTKKVVFESIGGSKAAPCRGIAHTVNDEKMLFVSNYPGPAGATEGLWAVNVKNVLDDSAVVTARAYGSKDDAFYQAGSYALAAYGDRLYSLPAPSTKTKNLKPCGEGNACVFQLKIDPKATDKNYLTLMKKGDAYDIIQEENITKEVTIDGQMLSCATGKLNLPGMGLAANDAHAFLFVSRCNDTAVYDVVGETPQKIDMDDRAVGVNNMATHLFGQFMHTFTLSPDGKTLWAVPANKSLMMFYADVNGKRASVNRFMAMPLDITGSKPVLKAEYNKIDIDDYSEKPEGSVDAYVTPVIDPGLDLTNFYLHQYIVKWYPSLVGATPTFDITSPQVAVAQHTLWLGNTTASSSATFGQYSDLAVYDLAAQRGVLFPAYSDMENFYRVFTNGNDSGRNFGFSLSPINHAQTATFGVVYINRD